MNAESKPEMVSVPRAELEYLRDGDIPNIRQFSNDLDAECLEAVDAIADKVDRWLAVIPAPAAPQEAKPCELCGGNGNALYQLLKLREPK
jgi:hypothetical protein